MAFQQTRIDWVDYTKGLTILLVVILHATHGVEKVLDTEGWMHHVIAFAQPFRMPVFFAVAGLFAAKSISKPWREFLDGKLVHFAYFYLLWVTIQFAFKAPFFAGEFGIDGTIIKYLTAFVQPFGLLWFIYLLPVYFIILRLSNRVPMVAQFALAILAKFTLTQTGISVLDFFSKYYVFFLVGHFGHSLWFKLAETAKERRILAGLGLVLWFVANAWIVNLGYNVYAPVAIVMGIVGFLAVIDFMALLPSLPMGARLAAMFRYCGQRSLPIYLGFFLPMGVTRLITMKLCETCDVGTIAFIVSLVAIVGALAMYEFVMKFKIGQFLYVRPDWTRLKDRRNAFVPAE